MKMKPCPLTLTLALATPLLAAGVAAAGEFTPPAGCTTFLTVQMKSCHVSNFWRCGDEDSDVWEGAYDGGGPLAVTQYDREFQWLSSFYAGDGTRERLADPGGDPISMTDLLETGEDSFAFVLESETAGEVQNLYVEGRDRLTGTERTIDGVLLLETDSAYTITQEDGSVTYRTSGQQFVSTGMRMFFLGAEETEQDGETVSYDNTPVDFVFPGEPGFRSTRPIYECDIATSADWPATAGSTSNGRMP